MRSHCGRLRERCLQRQSESLLQSPTVFFHMAATNAETAARGVVGNRQQRLEAVHARLRALEEGLPSRHPPPPRSREEVPAAATRPGIAFSDASALSAPEHAPRPPLPASTASESAGPAVGSPTPIAGHIILESEEQTTSVQHSIAVTPDRPWAEVLILALVRLKHWVHGGRDLLRMIAC